MLFPLWVSSITTPTTTTTMLNTKFLVRSDGFPFCVSILFSSVQFSSVAQLCPTLCVVAATNKSAPNRWLKTTKIYSLPVGQNSRGQNQGISQPLPRDSREDSIARLSQLLVTASISWLVAATLQSLPLCSHYLCACPVSLGFPVIWALVLVFRTHPGKSGQLLIGSPQI